MAPSAKVRSRKTIRKMKSPEARKMMHLGRALQGTAKRLGYLAEVIEGQALELRTLKRECQRLQGTLEQVITQRPPPEILTLPEWCPYEGPRSCKDCEVGAEISCRNYEPTGDLHD